MRNPETPQRRRPREKSLRRSTSGGGSKRPRRLSRQKWRAGLYSSRGCGRGAYAKVGLILAAMAGTVAIWTAAERGGRKDQRRRSEERWGRRMQIVAERWQRPGCARSCECAAGSSPSPARRRRDCATRQRFRGGGSARRRSRGGRGRLHQTKLVVLVDNEEEAGGSRLAERTLSTYAVHARSLCCNFLESYISLHRRRTGRVIRTFGGEQHRARIEHCT